MDSQTAETDAALIAAVKKYAKVIPTADLAGAPELSGIAEVNFAPADVFLRCYHYLHNDGSSVYMLVNEGTEVWRGTVTFAAEKEMTLRFTDMTPGKTSAIRRISTGQPGALGRSPWNRCRAAWVNLRRHRKGRGHRHKTVSSRH